MIVFLNRRVIIEKKGETGKEKCSKLEFCFVSFKLLLERNCVLQKMVKEQQWGYLYYNGVIHRMKPKPRRVKC